MAPDPIPPQAMQAAAMAEREWKRRAGLPDTETGYDTGRLRVLLEAAAPRLVPPAIIRFQGPDLTEAQVTELREKLKTALRTGRPELLPDDTDERIAEAVAAEREACAQIWRGILAEHYLAGITCDHETKCDNPVCACSRVHLDWHPTVGAAVQAWIDHVADAALLREARP